MAKTSSREDRAQKLRRKLAKAQADFERAQAVRATARTQGEEEVENARQQAAARLARATERLERRAAKITRIEAQLQALAPSSARPPSDRHGERGRGGADRSDRTLTSPAAVADALQTVELDEPAASDGLFVPDGPGDSAAMDLASHHGEAPPQS